MALHPDIAAAREVGTPALEISVGAPAVRERPGPIHEVVTVPGNGSALAARNATRAQANGAVRLLRDHDSSARAFSRTTCISASKRGVPRSGTRNGFDSPRNRALQNPQFTARSSQSIAPS